MSEKNPMNFVAGGDMLTNRRGFSLVELLVVVAISGIVVTIVLGLYVSVLRSTVSSEEVVEVQQGMRIALEQAARDIQMSGFLVPTDAPITVARNNQITLQTGSAFNSFARVSSNANFPLGSSAAVNIAVANGGMAQLFSTGAYVRIVDSATNCQLSSAPACGNGGSPYFKVTFVGASSLTLEPMLAGSSYAPAAPIQVQTGDFIVQVPSPADDPAYPNVVTYTLITANNILFREWKVGATSAGEGTIATNITGLRFEYLMDDGTVAPAPTAALGTAVPASQLDNIVAVRIFLTGLTEEEKTGVSKTRELQTTVKLRNI